MTLSKLEQATLEMLLAGDYPPLIILRKQLAGLIVSDRKMTGGGFFTKFQISAAYERLKAIREVIFGDVKAEIPGLESGAGFLLYIKGGALYQLEGYAYSEDWPTEVRDFRLSYFSGTPFRDLEKIKNKFEPT